MSVTYTAEQLINKAASILGKYVPGEALGAVEHDTINDCIDTVLSEINKIVALGDRDAIPDLLFETIARMVAIRAAASFSNADPDLSALAAQEQRLRYLVAQTPTYAVLGANYF